MSTIERVLQAVRHVEENLHGDVDLEAVARAARLSRFHFSRIFRALTGESVCAYVRRRRLTEACRALAREDASILDVAMEHGFESQAAFTRAFRRHFGITPGSVRREGIGLLHLSGPLTRAQIEHLRGVGDMEPGIKNLPAFTVVGMTRSYTMETTKEIPRLWDAFVPRMKEIDGALGGRAFGVCESGGSDDGGTEKETSEFQYTAALEVSAFHGPVPTGMRALVVPAGDWAVFRHVGPVEEIARTYDHVYGTWLPASGWDVVGGLDFELYGEDFDDENPSSPESVVEIHLPVRRRK